MAQEATGQGHATAALEALLGFATTTLRATDIYAGVTHGNTRSAALLGRTGFTRTETFDTYSRYHRAL
ncbi:GNAT family N-acetyltransferase [Devosia sp.]|uniref:GNAT family N-acetyltransferase n=1 Tax=Devosia sp. TaxID=1871048 RepID=UPI003A90B184